MARLLLREDFVKSNPEFWQETNKYKIEFYLGEFRNIKYPRHTHIYDVVIR